MATLGPRRGRGAPRPGGNSHALGPPCGPLLGFAGRPRGYFHFLAERLCGSPDQSRGAEALVGLLGHGADEDVVELGRQPAAQLRGAWGWLDEMRVEREQGTLVGVRWRPGQALEEHAGQRVSVALGSEWPTPDLLGRAVVRALHVDAQSLRQHSFAADAEVGEKGVRRSVVVEKDRLGRQLAMHELLSGRRVERARHAGDHPKGVARLEGALAQPIREPGRAPKLAHHVQAAVVLAYLEQSHEMWMIDGRPRAGHTNGLAPLLRVGGHVVQQLDSHPRSARGERLDEDGVAGSDREHSLDTEAIDHRARLQRRRRLERELGSGARHQPPS